MKDNEVNRRLMEEINREAEANVKGMMSKKKVGLIAKEQKKLKDAHVKKKVAEIKEKVGSNVEEKARLKDVEIKGKCGIRVETEEMRMKSKGSEGFELEPKRLPKQRICGASARRRLEFREVEMKSHTSKSVKQMLQSNTVAEVRKGRTQRKETESNPAKSALKKVLKTDKAAKSKLQNARLRPGYVEMSSQIRDDGDDESRGLMPFLRRKIAPNTCGVCSALATRRHYNARSCDACAAFFRKSVTSQKPHRLCMVSFY